MVTYSPYSLLRFHVSRGLSVSKYIFRRRETAVTGDSISFTNGPVTRGNFCNILNRTLQQRSASSCFSASSSSFSFSSSLSIPSPLSRTGMELHCLWTFSRRLYDDDSRNMHRLARLALRIITRAAPYKRNARFRTSETGRYSRQFRAADGVQVEGVWTHDGNCVDMSVTWQGLGIRSPWMRLERKVSHRRNGKRRMGLRRMSAYRSTNWHAADIIRGFDTPRWCSAGENIRLHALLTDWK